MDKNVKHASSRPSVAYLVYRRLRPALGLPFGFIVMYGAYTGNLDVHLLLAGLGFVFIEVMGGWYNDYWDYEEDIQNGRRDKFTTAGYLSRRQMRDLSFAAAGIGLLFLLFTNLTVLSLGIYYVILFIGYSNPKIRLKGHVPGYLILSTAFLLLPAALNTLFARQTTARDAYFTLFCFFQFTYILCQKDATDLKDKNKNLFLDNDWNTASFYCTAFAVLASAGLLASSPTPAIFIVWTCNALTKTANLTEIWKKKLTRKLRSRLILLEFLTPYLYAIALLLTR